MTNEPITVSDEDNEFLSKPLWLKDLERYLQRMAMSSGYAWKPDSLAIIEVAGDGSWGVNLQVDTVEPVEQGKAL